MKWVKIPTYDLWISEREVNQEISRVKKINNIYYAYGENHGVRIQSEFSTLKEAKKVGKNKYWVERSMNKYVLALILSENKVLLILKNKPDFQKNKLNLPGGKIEEGESPEIAVAREVYEETGMKAEKIKQYGIISCANSIVYCFNVCVADTALKPREEETEKCFWMDLSDAFKDSRLMSNLRIIIPLMINGITEFTIKDEPKKDTCEFLVSIGNK